MSTDLIYFKKYNYGNGKRVTLPIFLLIVYMVSTYFPRIYTFFPFFGTIKLVLLAGILLVISYLASRGKYHNLMAYKHPLVFAWAGFLLFMFLGLIDSIDRGYTLLQLKICLKHFLMFMIMIKIIDNPKRLNLIIGVLVFCSIGMGLSSVVAGQVVGKYRIIAIQGGIFGDPNDLALFLNCTLPFLLFFYMKGEKRILMLIGMIVVLMAAVLTHSRGGFVGLCVLGASVVMFSVKRNKIYIFFIFAVSFLVWSYAPETYKRRISTIFETRIDESGKTDTRADTWIPALKAGLENPITGLGAGTSLYVMGRIFKDWHSVHNSFVQAISEIGIIGGFFYISLFIIPFRHYRNYIKRNALLTTEDLLRMQAIMLSFISYIATGFFLPQAYFPVLYMLTGFFVIQGELIRKRTVNLMLKTSSSRSSDRIMQKNIKDNSNYFFNRGS